MHHFFDRIDYDRLIDPLFLGDLFDNPVQIDLHSTSPGRGLLTSFSSALERLSDAIARRDLSFSIAKVVLVIGSMYLIECKRLAMPFGRVFELDSARTHIHQLSDERFGPVARRMRSNFHFLA